jgi:hypothetical protein
VEGLARLVKTSFKYYADVLNFLKSLKVVAKNLQELKEESGLKVKKQI